MIRRAACLPRINEIFAMTSVKFEKSFLHMDVLCVRHYHDYILAGIGDSLFVYKNGALLLTQPIFRGERIHSISTRNDLILLKGGRQLCLVKLESSPDFKCEILTQMQSFDWVQDVIMLENQLIGVVTAHNAFECWSWESEKHLSTSSCEETCILYSCKITGDLMENVTVFAGTVFGDVLIWSPSTGESSLLHRLKAHNGAVFSIEVKPDEKLMTTTSDDRSLKVWSVISQQPMTRPNDWKGSNIQLSHTLFGHTARVWRSMILPAFYLTAGEDSQLIAWSKDGRMIRSLVLHQESGIRSVDCSGETNTVATGGEDGGINAFSVNHLTSEADAKKILDLGQSPKVSVTTKVSFTKSGLVYTLNGSCVSGAGEEVMYESEEFSPYCVLEVSPGGEYIAMGSIRGHVVVTDSRRKRVVDEQRLDGRVYSIHWLGGFLLTCGPEGRLILWELTSGGLEKINTMSLPSCRERWTTCGDIHNGELVVGDRMGGVHVFELRGGEMPLKSFRKMHGYLGVTDVKSVGGVCLSVGRDGTIKEFTEDVTLSTTFKLPMEWPWKIVSHEKDIMILGFRGSSFVVWSTKRREVIGSHDCGGGHRSCDYRIHENQLSFLYVKDKKVFVAVLPLDGVTRVRNGFHGREINCLKILRKDPPVVVTGSEDTTLRVSVINGSDVEQMAVLKTHVSSVRALCVRHTGSEKATIVSAGGKGQIVVWDLDVNAGKCREMANHRLRKEVQNWKSPATSIDPETRLMCVDVFKSESEFLVAVGCSDCRIRIFSYRGELNLLCEIPYTHCVLKVGVLRADSSRVLVTMGTDGKAVFWDITDCRAVRQLASFSLHQSGINSFQFEEVGCGEFILATGGDDNLVSVAFVEIEGKKVSLRQVWENRTTHSCQVTGIKILKNFLVTASIDQRITVWRWSRRKDEFTAHFMNQCMTAVPDIQGMDATWQDPSTILVAVHGKGLETFKIYVDSPHSESG